MAHTEFTLRIPRVLNTEGVSEVKRKLLLLMPADASIDHRVVQPKFTYEIKHDADCDSPRESECLGILKCEHNRYACGDKDAELPFVDDDWRANVLKPEVYLCLDVWGYEHGGLAMSHVRSGQFADQFDSGRLGWHYVTRERVAEWFPDQYIDGLEVRDKVERALKAELEEMNLWLSGECWGYVIKDEEDEVVDSCWGFITDDVEPLIESAGTKHHAGLRTAWKERE